MQTVYSKATLCKRPSDVGTERADKCYSLSPGGYDFLKEGLFLSLMAIFVGGDAIF